MPPAKIVQAPKALVDGAFMELAGRLDFTIDEALRAVEEAYLNELMRSEDASEGLQAFLEKRPPTWRHR